MKKIVSIFLALMVFFSTLLVINIYQTKEQERLENIESTEASFKLYVSNTDRTPEEVVSFFQKLSQQEKITVIRSDYPNNNVVKSAIVNEASFPYENFFQKQASFQLFSQGNERYTNSKKPENHDASIPTFSNPSEITLQSLQEYFKAGDKSANGIYTIIPSSNKNPTELLSDFSTFFNTSTEDLTTPKMQSRKEYINRDLLIYFGLFIILALVTLLSVIAIPMIQIKQIGVYKLSGFKTLDIFKQLFLLPILSVIFTSLLLDGLVLGYFDYLPQYFLLTVLLLQLTVIGILSVAILLVFSVIRSVTIVQLIKNSLSFRVGTILMLVLKTGIIILTTVILIANLASMREVAKATANYNQVSEDGQALTIEKLGFASDEAYKNFELNNGANENIMAELFVALEKQTKAHFIYGEDVVPVRNFPTYVKPNMFTEADTFQVVRTNLNYLESIKLEVKASTGENVFLVPVALEKERAKIEELAKLLVYDRLSDSVRQETTSDESNVTIEFYSDPQIQTSLFKNNERITFSTPIYEVVHSNNLDQKSKVQLLTTGAASPLKIANTASNRAVLKSVASPEQLHGITLNFATIKSILNTDADSSRLGLQIMLTLLLIIFLVSLVVSGFVCILYFNTNKLKIAILRSLGIKLFDRYQGLCFYLCAAYLVQLLIATIYGGSLVALAIGILLTGMDLLLTLALFYHQENKNLVQVLKGE